MVLWLRPGVVVDNIIIYSHNFREYIYMLLFIYEDVFVCEHACTCVYAFNKLSDLGWTCLSTCALDKTVLL